MGKLLSAAVALCLLAAGSFGQTVTPSGSVPYVPLVVDGASAGNTAVTNTEEVLKTYTVPANTLNNIGDVLEITAGGVMGATTDVKTAGIRVGGIGGALCAAPSGNAASMIRWYGSARLVKTGTTAMSITGFGAVLNGSNNGTSSGTTNITTTASTDVVITGKNATNSVAGSVTVQYFSVTLIRAPGT